MSPDRGTPSEEADVNQQPSEEGGGPSPAAFDQPPQPVNNPGSGEQADGQNAQELQAGMEVASGAKEAMNAAWLSAGADVASALISLISIALVVYALMQTNKSLRLAQKDRADATRRAVSQTEETAEALRYAEASALAMSRVSETAVENAEQVRESVNQQRTLGRMQVRPFLSIQIGRAEWQDSGHNFAAYPILHNTGQTPARNIQYRITAQVLPSVIYPEFKFWLPEKTGGNNTIGPTQTGTMMAVMPWRVPDDWVTPVKLGIHFSLYVWGVVAYDDNFGTRHRATFAQQIFWRRIGFMGEDGTIPEVVEGIFLGRHNRSS